MTVQNVSYTQLVIGLVTFTDDL